MAMKTPVHPGEILREDVLADLGLGVGDAAARLGISRVSLSRVLHGHARISPNLAVRLEQAGAGTARAWLAMQTAHDLALERSMLARLRLLSTDQSTLAAHRNGGLSSSLRSTT